MDRIDFKRIRLRKLRDLIESGVFAVPELQREFVWSAKKACDLLDSIYRHYPIGTLLIWKTNRRNEGQLRKHLHILPHFNPTNRHIYFLVDGQQRLSVLWHLLRGEAAEVVTADRQTIDFGKVYFNPYAAGSDLFLYRRRLFGELAEQLVPVIDVLSSGWRRRVGHRGTRVLRRIEDARRRILNYEAFLVFFETDLLADVRDTFVRINSLGMRIGAADRAFARSAKFDMRGRVREAEARLKYDFDQVRSETILQTMALAMDGRDVGERAIDAMISKIERDEKERARFDRLWPSLREAFAIATDYIVHELGVPNFGFLPSEPMLITLTLYFYHNGNVRPSRAAKRRLQKWFWATAVGARYTGRGHRPNILKDADFARRLAVSPKAHGEFEIRVPMYMLRRTEYGRPGPLSNAFFCLLRLHKPRYLEDGSHIPLGEISARGNRSDKHHIFPRALLNAHGIGAERYNSILNICYLVARENQSIGQRAPRHYFEVVPRSNWARTMALRSHLIPTSDSRGIWDTSTKRGFKAFLEDRARIVARAFERQAGLRLFERG